MLDRWEKAGEKFHLPKFLVYPFPFGRLCSLCGVAARLLKDDLGSPLLSEGTVGAYTTPMARLHSFPDAEAALSQQSDLVAALFIFSLDIHTSRRRRRRDSLEGSLPTAQIISQRPDHRSAREVPENHASEVSGLLSGRGGSGLGSPQSSRNPRVANWNDFLGLAEERLRLFQYFRSPEYIRIKFCDKIMCNAFEWKADHRQPCKSFSAGISRSIVPELNKREDTFLRLIVHTEYQAHKLDILRHQPEYICAHGGEHDFFTLLDYRTGRCEISAKSTGPMVGPKYAETPPTTPDTSAGPWCFSRMGLYTVLLDGGRTAILSQYGEIKADTISLADKEEVQMRLRRLCEMKVVETHG
ncbi:hypothetical protein B0H14DRAFT_3445291 [Mycena olivaceomarginata]|nr:hypothetical protein B0H14DRAFT_3445291 [Mycena olivaceomarginata]